MACLLCLRLLVHVPPRSKECRPVQWPKTRLRNALLLVTRSALIDSTPPQQRCPSEFLPLGRRRISGAYTSCPLPDVSLERDTRRPRLPGLLVGLNTFPASCPCLTLCRAPPNQVAARSSGVVHLAQLPSSANITITITITIMAKLVEPRSKGDTVEVCTSGDEMERDQPPMSKDAQLLARLGYKQGSTASP